MDLNRTSRNLPLKDHFGLPIIKGEITIPLDYKSNNYVDKMRQKIRSNYFKDTQCFEKEIASVNFSKVTHQLNPGDTYEWKLIPIISKVSTADCLLFSYKQKSLLVNVHGLMFIYEVAKEKLPKNKWVISLDKEKALWKDVASGGFRIVNLHVHEDGTYFFNLSYFYHVLNTNHCLLLIKKVKKRII